MRDIESCGPIMNMRLSVCLTQGMLASGDRRSIRNGYIMKTELKVRQFNVHADVFIIWMLLQEDMKGYVRIQQAIQRI